MSPFVYILLGFFAVSNVVNCIAIWKHSKLLQNAIISKKEETLDEN